MKLYTQCANCKSEITMRTTAADRFILAKKRGEHIKLNCSACGTPSDYHVNDLKAEESRFIGLVSVLLCLAGTMAILVYLWPYLVELASVYAISSAIAILTVPFMIYQAINFGQVNRVKYFNAKRYG